MEKNARLQEGIESSGSSTDVNRLEEKYGNKIYQLTQGRFYVITRKQFLNFIFPPEKQALRASLRQGEHDTKTVLEQNKMFKKRLLEVFLFLSHFLLVN